MTRFLFLYILFIVLQRVRLVRLGVLLESPTHPDSTRVVCQRGKVLFFEDVRDPVIVGTLGNKFGIGALAVLSGSRTGVEDLAQGTALFPGHPVDAEEILATIGRVWVFGEGSGGCSLWTRELAALLVDGDDGSGAFGNFAGPETLMADLVVC